METTPPTSINLKCDQFTELLQSLIRHRPPLILPEHILQFRKQMDELKSGNLGSREDYQFIFRIFIILAHQETPPTMGELSLDLNVPFSTATRIVDWLVQGDFVERTPDPDDRRIIRVRLTQTGQKYYQISIDYIRLRINKILEDFSTEEQAELYRLLSKLLAALIREE
jgi:DNA-binding MarR family transcriptional regulator